VLDAAATLFNEHGLKGVTLSDVASRVGLNTTSLTYYFSRKDDLAGACALRSIQALVEIVHAATAQVSVRERVAAFVGGYVQLLREIAERRRADLINFHDTRALTGPAVAVVFDAFQDLFRHVRHLTRDGANRVRTRAEENARAYLLLALTTDAQSWIGRYETDDFGRVAHFMIDVLLDGLNGANGGRPGSPLVADDERWLPEVTDVAHSSFLRAATALINEQGYRGASVERISARLNVTKGSFYHHHESKDDLLLSCFERSFEIVRAAQRWADSKGGTGWMRVWIASESLMRYQVSARGPLLRYRALNAVPITARQPLLAARARLTKRFAGMIFDGIVDRSIRPVDPTIAAQMLDGAINAAANVRRWADGIDEDNVCEDFAKPFFTGLLN
jgi:AcrR family transcriptional regulator